MTRSPGLAPVLILAASAACGVDGGSGGGSDSGDPWDAAAPTDDRGPDSALADAPPDANDAGDATVSADAEGGTTACAIEGGTVSPPGPCSPSAPNVACAGDGVTDDTACLRSALNAAALESVLPGGKTYLVSGALAVTSGRSVIGNGSTLLSQGAAPILAISGNSVTVCGVQVVQHGTSANAPLVVLSPGATGISFTNGAVMGTGPIGLYIAPGGPTGPVLIQGNSFDGTSYPILLNAGKQGSSRSNYQHDITIDRNTFTGAKADAIEINSPVFNTADGSRLPGIAVYNITITNNRMSEQAEFGIGFAGGTDSVVCGNMVANTGFPPGSADVQGIHIEDRASNLQVVGNTISHTVGVASSHSGIEVLQSDHVYLYANRIEATSTGSGIELSWDPAGNHDYGCAIAANHISGSGAFGINVGGLPDAAVDTVIGPSGGYGGNVTEDSGKPGNQSGQGSINCTPGNGITVSGNSGN